MREVSEKFLQAVQGSNQPVVTANIWRDGEVIREGLRPAGGSVEFSAAQAVEGSLHGAAFVDEDPDAVPIDAYGCKVNVLAGFDLQGSVETVSMGWFNITEVDTVEAWSWFPWQSEAALTNRVITVEGFDSMGVVAESDFLAPRQPTAGADAWTTIADLCAGVVSVLNPGFVAKTIPATGLVFEWSRLDAIKAIARLWDAYPIITENDQLTLATDSSGASIDAFGAQINIDWWQKQSSSSGLKNGVTYSGKTADGIDLTGYATETSGLLRWGGPYGFRPARMSSDLMDTQAKVDAAAKTYLDTLIARRSSSQNVSALWNPAIELRDMPPLMLPGDAPVTAQVDAYTLPLLGGPMSVTLRLPWRA